MDIRHFGFLRQIITIGFTAFGGPMAHLSLIFKILVDRRKYLKEEELLELLALCQLLPGPTSTQLLMAIGYKRGGWVLAFATLICWTLPVFLLVLGVLFFLHIFEAKGKDLYFLQYMGPMSVGFIAFAALRLSKSIVYSKSTFFILLVSFLLTVFFRTPYAFPLILIFGGLSSFLWLEQKKPKAKQPRQRIQIQWRYLGIFLGVLVLAAILGGITKSKPILLFENTYRFGSIIFGGGQVLIPMLYEQFVEFKAYLTAEQFLSGYGIMQAMPGPVFAFVSYLGGMSMRELGLSGQLLGAVIATVGIFLPGSLLIVFILPVWEKFKKIKFIHQSLLGINLAAAGMVCGAAYIILESIGFEWSNVLLAVVTILVLQFTKIPPPFIVLAFIVLGLYT